MAEHTSDHRPVLYSAQQLDSAETRDPLWNAAQVEMVRTGRMHNYMRMYWAKKILEWTRDPETAFQIALDLNDRYERCERLYGRSLGDWRQHDRAWLKHPIFGTIRYLSYEGMRHKFNTEAYIDLNRKPGNETAGECNVLCERRALRRARIGDHRAAYEKRRIMAASNRSRCCRRS
jgi:hypothetical protein